MAYGSDDWNRVVERFLAGDEAAALRIIRFSQGTLRSIRASDFLGDEDLIQDVLAALVGAARKGQLPEDGPGIRRYLAGIVRNKFLDRLRRRPRRAEESAPVEFVCWDEWMTSLLDRPEPTPGIREAVQSALRQLPERVRTVVVLSKAHGRTIKQVSEDTGIPEGTAKRYLRQGLEQLEALLGEVLGR